MSSTKFTSEIDGYLEELSRLQVAHWPKEVPTDVVAPLEESTVTGYVREWARQRPDHPALAFHGSIVTYAELDRLSDRVAAYLVDRGAKAGDRAAVMMPNCPQFIVVFLGILKAGCVHVPVNPMFRRLEIEYELQDSGARWMFIVDDLAEEFLAVKATSSIEGVVATNMADALVVGAPVPDGVPVDAPPLGGADRYVDVVADDSLEVPTDPAQPDALAALNYTGGTTGMPKGCEHSQRDMVYTGVTGGVQNFAMGPDAVTLVYIPVFWIAGEDGFLLPLMSGGTCVLQYRWDAVEAVQAVERHRITVLLGTVDNFLELMDVAARDGKDLSSVETAVTMSFVTKLSEEIRDRWARESGSPSVLRESSYGMTEDHTLDTFTRGLEVGGLDLTGRPGFTGLPVPGTQFAVVDFDTGDLVPLGGEGQIVVRSASMMKGYYGRPEATATTIIDGWLQTGDSGMIDERGCLHYLGRRKEMLKVNGMSVFPSELEFALSRHPDIAASGVVGIADDAKGERPLAFVELKPSAVGSVDAEQIRTWCRTNMATYKVPLVRIVDAMPLAPTGKVLKSALVDMAAGSGVG